MTKRRFFTRKRAIFLGIATVGLIAVACGSGDDDAPISSVATSVPIPTSTAVAEPTTVPGPASTKAVTEVKELTSQERRFVSSALRSGWRTNFDKRLISLGDLLSGGVPRDGIPPIDNPTFAKVASSPDFLEGPEPVIALEVNGDARAYPLRILQQHEIVNDIVGGVPVAVTFCPLCNSSVAFERTVDGDVLRFGVSGFLRNSDLIMWDDKTESFWQQLTGEAIVGDQVGKSLKILPAQTVSWTAFKEAFPDGSALEPPRRTNYQNTPYTGYDDSDNQNPFLFLGEVDPRLPAVTRVAAFDLGTGAVAYSFPFLAENPVINDVIGDSPIVIFFDNETESAFRSRQLGGEFSVVGSSTAYFREVDGRVLTFSADGNGTLRDDQTGTTWDRFGRAKSGELAGTELDPVIHGDHFWFAWASFKPDTRLVDSTALVTAG